MSPRFPAQGWGALALSRALRPRALLRAWWGRLPIFLALLFSAVVAGAASAESGLREQYEVRDSSAAEPRTSEPAALTPAPIRQDARRLQPKDALEPGPGVQLPAAPESYHTHDGGWLQIDFAPSIRSRIEPLIHEGDAFRVRLREIFGAAVLEHVTVRVARTPGEMATLAPPNSPFPKYAEGVAYPRIGLVLLTIEPLHPNSVHDLGEVFRHELVHLALDEALDGHHVPLWLNEGIAIHLSGESMLARMQTLWTATLAETLLPLAQLDQRFPDDWVQTPIAYAESADVVRHLLRTRYNQRFMAMLRRVRGGEAFDSAMNDAYGVQPYGIGQTSLEDEWRREVAKRYSFWPVLFSGSMVWIGTLGLFFVGYARRRKQQRLTLERWAVEEAAEQAAAVRARDPLLAGRMHIVLAPKAGNPEVVLPEFKKSALRELEVPKVEHDGSWYTLH
ncbi:MAG TPA: hypothetical protein VG963_23355 [Polyangiaceae bacterium]|nr:hypothetical protein [Polyangiaceae bacterium]